jgi:hypothetical protein
MLVDTPIEDGQCQVRQDETVILCNDLLQFANRFFQIASVFEFFGFAIEGMKIAHW